MPDKSIKLLTVRLKDLEIALFAAFKTNIINVECIAMSGDYNNNC